MRSRLIKLRESGRTSERENELTRIMALFMRIAILRTLQRHQYDTIRSCYGRFYWNVYTFVYTRFLVLAAASQIQQQQKWCVCLRLNANVAISKTKCQSLTNKFETLAPWFIFRFKVRSEINCTEVAIFFQEIRLKVLIFCKWKFTLGGFYGG